MRAAVAFAALTLCVQPSLAQTHVDGHFRRDGTYVPPHYRSNPDGNRFNNWSATPNVNPYTGQRGTQDPYRAQQPGSNNLYAPQNPYHTPRRY